MVLMRTDIILDFLRAAVVCLAFFFIGVNISIIRRHYEKFSTAAILGRIGLALAIILLFAGKLLDRSERFGYIIIDVMVITSFVMSTVGSLYHTGEHDDGCTEENSNQEAHH